MKKDAFKEALQHAFEQLLRVYAKWLFLFAACIYFASGFYVVERNSVGVHTRFGKVINGHILPGLHYKLPWPVDHAVLVPVKQVKTISLNDFGSKYKLPEGERSHRFYKRTGLDPYCITGDNNIVAITVDLEYTIEDAEKYLSGTKQPETLVERASANLIIHHLASLRIDDVLTSAKKQLEFELHRALAKALVSFDTGIHISFLEIKEVTPPALVQDDFDRVINAEVEKNQSLNEAQGYYNRIVPEARSAANRLLREAEAYKREKTLTAEGETAQFISQLEGYSKNSQAHRQKIYLEFISELYPKLGEVRVIKTDKPQEQALSYTHRLIFE